MVAQHTTTTTRSGSGLAGRILLTLLGAAGLIVGGLLQWWNGTVGTDLTVRAFYQTTFDKAGSFVSSVGAVMILLGLLAVVGLVGSSGGLTRLAGALGVVGVVLFAIQAYRTTSSVSTELDQIDIGVWLALAGALVAVVGGFLGRTRVVTGPATVVADEDI